MDTSGLFLGSVYSTLQFKTGGFAQDVAGAQRDLRGLGKDFSQAESQSSAFAASLGTAVSRGLLVAGGAAVAAGGASIKMAGDFEQSLNVLRYNSNATASEFAALSERARELGQDATLPGISAASAAQAMNELAKAGLSVNDVLGASKGVLSLAKAGNIDVGLAAATTARALNAFGLAGSEATRIADLLAAAANASTADVGDLALGLQQAGSGSKQMGVNLQDTVAALALFSNAGIAGSDAGTSLKTMFQALANPTKESSDLMKQLGLDFFDASGNFVGLEKTADQLQTQLGKLSTEQRNAALATIFGSDASRVAGVLADSGAKKFSDLRTAVTKQGAASKASAAANSGFNGSLDNLVSTLQTAGTDIGTKLLPPITEFVKVATDQVNPTIDFLIRNGAGLALTIGILGGAFAAVRLAAFASDLKGASDTLSFFLGAKNATGIRALGDGISSIGGKSKDAALKITDIASGAASSAASVSKKGLIASGGWIISAGRSVGAWTVGLAKVVASAVVSGVRISAAGIIASAGWVANAVRVSAAWTANLAITVAQSFYAGLAMRSPATAAALAWAAGAIASGAAWTAQFVLMIARSIVAGIVMSAQAVVAGVAWTVNAVAVAAAWTAQFAITIVRAGLAGIAIAAHAVVAAAGWLAQPLLIAGAWTAQFAVVIARSLFTGGAMSGHAAVAGGAWVLNAGLAAGAWFIRFLALVPFMLGSAVGMAAQGLIAAAGWVAGAVAATAAWIVANLVIFGIFFLIAAAAAAAVYLIIKNWETVKTFFQALPGRITGFFSGLGNSLYSVGRDMIQGLLNGAGSLLPTVGKFFLSQLPSFMVKPFKAALDINSPSRVFAGYGVNVVQGLVGGVSGSKRLVTSAMGDLTSQMTVGSLTRASELTSASGRTSADAQTAQGSGATRGGLNVENYNVYNDIDPERILRDMNRRLELAR